MKLLFLKQVLLQRDRHIDLQYHDLGEQREQGGTASTTSSLSFPSSWRDSTPFGIDDDIPYTLYELKRCEPVAGVRLRA